MHEINTHWCIVESSRSQKHLSSNEACQRIDRYNKTKWAMCCWFRRRWRRKGAASIIITSRKLRCVKIVSRHRNRRPGRSASAKTREPSRPLLNRNGCNCRGGTARRTQDGEGMEDASRFGIERRLRGGFLARCLRVVRCKRPIGHLIYVAFLFLIRLKKIYNYEASYSFANK